MKSAKQLINAAVINEAYRYITYDPMKNLPKLIDWAEKVMVVKDFKETAALFHEIAKDPGNNWNRLMQRCFSELNLNTQKKFLVNFMVNAGIVGNAVVGASLGAWLAVKLAIFYHDKLQSLRCFARPVSVLETTRLRKSLCLSSPKEKKDCEGYSIGRRNGSKVISWFASWPSYWGGSLNSNSTNCQSRVYGLLRVAH